MVLAKFPATATPSPCGVTSDQISLPLFSNTGSTLVMEKYSRLHWNLDVLTCDDACACAGYLHHGWEDIIGGNNLVPDLGRSNYSRPVHNSWLTNTTLPCRCFAFVQWPSTSALQALDEPRAIVTAVTLRERNRQSHSARSIGDLVLTRGRKMKKISSSLNKSKEQAITSPQRSSQKYWFLSLFVCRSLIMWKAAPGKAWNFK